MSFWDIIGAALRPEQQQGPFLNGGFNGGAQPRVPQGPIAPMPAAPASPQIAQTAPWSPSPLMAAVSTAERFRMPGRVAPRPAASPMAPSAMAAGPSQLTIEDIMNMLSSSGMPSMGDVPQPQALASSALPNMGAAPIGGAGIAPHQQGGNRLSALMRAILPGV